MPITSLYARVLRLLGPQARLGWALAVANVALALVQFAEPVLLGRIIDSLAQSQGGGPSLSWEHLLPLLAAWVGFELFMIVAQRARGAVRRPARPSSPARGPHPILRAYPRASAQFSRGYHSGRLMKVMLSGTDTLWGLWLGFFREDLVALVSILVLVPMSLYLNWRLGLPLIALCLIFVMLTGALRRARRARRLDPLPLRGGRVGLGECFGCALRDLRRRIEFAPAASCRPSSRASSSVTRFRATVSKTSDLELRSFARSEEKASKKELVTGPNSWPSGVGVTIQFSGLTCVNSSKRKRDRSFSSRSEARTSSRSTRSRCPDRILLELEERSIVESKFGNIGWGCDSLELLEGRKTLVLLRDKNANYEVLPIVM